ncbi:MAG: hypothetical protein ACI85Z_001370, partial [Rheinheimera aquimaris]
MSLHWATSLGSPAAFAIGSTQPERLFSQQLFSQQAL